MEWLVATFVFSIFLAYSNGANDNFKGVATLFGSKTATYNKALIWTSITTFLGAITALFIASELVIVFKGKGLVPSEVISMSAFPVAVGLGAALTVMLATILGLPVSTTHALIGALAGAGWMASASGINGAKLAEKFFLPLIAGPLISMLLAFVLYPLFRKIRELTSIEPETCVCIGNKVVATVPAGISTPHEAAKMLEMNSVALPQAVIADEAYCRSSYSGSVLGVSARNLLDTLHYASGGLVCFARGLNDTPKIAALLLIGSAFSLHVSIAAVGVAMVIGGLIHSRKIAETMGDRITEMQPGQAFTANLVTGIMVFGASKIGVPVSTTHVSCGSIFGIGAVTKKAKWDTIKKILVAWVTTLPLGALLGLIAMAILS